MKKKIGKIVVVSALALAITSAATAGPMAIGFNSKYSFEKAAKSYADTIEKAAENFADVFEMSAENFADKTEIDAENYADKVENLAETTGDAYEDNAEAYPENAKNNPNAPAEYVDTCIKIGKSFLAGLFR